MAKVGIIDYGSGNFSSVWNAVSSLTIDIERITKPKEFDKCSHIILPGVGAFTAAMKKISNLSLREKLLEDVVIKKKEFLGICVGMQVLASTGLEFEETDGLNLIPGIVKKIALDERQYSLPHIGWNTVIGLENSRLFKTMDQNDCFYFVHSYHLDPLKDYKESVWCDYGKRFLAAISDENIHGVQFHPEKSQAAGLKLLSNFIFNI